MVGGLGFFVGGSFGGSRFCGAVLPTATFRDRVHLWFG